MSQLLELPDAIYQALLQTARLTGATPADWIASHLPAHENGAARREPSPEEIDAADASLEQYIYNHGQTSSDNTSIDADLVREYGNNAF